MDLEYQQLRRRASHYFFSYALERKSEAEAKTLFDASAELELGQPTLPGVVEAVLDRLSQDLYRNVEALPRERLLSILSEKDPK
jgi:hypothetical protein